MLYLVFIRLTGWMSLLTPSAASKDAETADAAPGKWLSCGGGTLVAVKRRTAFQRPIPVGGKRADDVWLGICRWSTFVVRIGRRR
jgi:hypothetical protein